MDKIKTLVRYDANEMTIWDADDESLGFFTPDGSDVDAVGNQIATALNTAADQAQVIEVMRTALEHFDGICSTCLSAQDAHDENGEVDMMDEIGRMVCGTPYYPATDALAEAQRIMEGK